MTKFGLLLGVLFVSLQLLALPKASDFKELGTEDEHEETAATATSAAESTKPATNENEELVSGTVRIIRKIEMTEVFFKDLKDSYFIPSGANYGSIYKACQESEKKGSRVGLKVNKKTRRILSVESSAIKNPATSGAETKSSGTAGTK